MAQSREIFQWIKNKIPFQQANKEKGSHYTTIGGVLVRISNHCTWMKIWENYFQINPKDKGKPILSIVFEDGDNTYTEECLFTLSPLRKPIKVTEYVYKSPLNKSQVTEIIQNLKLLLRGVEFTNPLKTGKKWDRVSVNPDFMNIETTLDKRAIPAGGHGADEILESISNKYMKQTITESQLRSIIAESVKKCISELNGYHPTPNTDKNAWRGQKRGEGTIDKDGYPIQKPVQTPKPMGNQKAAPSDDRMRKMNEGLFGPSKKQIAAQQAARQAERDRKQAEWDEWQKANSDRIASQYQSEYNKRSQQRDYADRVQKQKDAEELESYKNSLRNQPQQTFVVYKRGGGVAGETTNQQEAEQWAKQVGGTYATKGNAPWNNY